MKIQKINENIRIMANDTDKKIKKPNRIRFWIKLILTLVLFGAMLVLITFLPFFNVARIEVNGNLHYDAETYINAIEADVGDNGFKFISGGLLNILSFRYGRSELNILENYPYVKDVIVRYVIPDRVVIDVIERKPVVLVPYYGTYLVMDNEGYIVDSVKDPGDENLPVVRGFVFDNYEIGHALIVDNPQKIKQLVKLTSQIRESDEVGGYTLSDKILFYDVNDINNILVTLNEELIVNLGDLRDLRYRLDTLKEILKSALKNEKGLLDFTAGENPVFIQNYQ
ncbi:MAG TPA: FtsQ-type POTRA domain-containing protein [Clostridiaceae bacterium]|nr:FtsQ-type POTRA domain-containing protein [Clostridiaceae bacterium]